MNCEDIQRSQLNICSKYGSKFVQSPPGLKLGISSNVRLGMLPIYGLRHLPTEDTCGWYIWAGETLLDDPDFFLPLHVEHLEQWAPSIIRFLGLAPGWRFLISGSYEDVWQDKSLLDV